MRGLTVRQENYGRAKETHAHTQTLWEKEIRRARKETFKTQSANVKLQEELKTARSAVKILEDANGREKERSRVREQEAFEARYQIVGVQEQLEEALARIKVVEQERDAFKTAAKNEEVARIAAEGRIPLPAAEDPDDEFASPPKRGQKKRKISGDGGRYSLSSYEIESSAATEMEIEELNSQVLWERQRAERAQDMVEFLQAECEMQCCPCGRPKPRASIRSSLPEIKQSPKDHIEVSEPLAEEAIEEHVENRVEELIEEPAAEPMEESLEEPVEEPVENEDPDIIEAHTPREEVPESALSPLRYESQGQASLELPRSKKGPRRSTIFCPKEGIFRTVSEQEAEMLQAQEEAEIIIEDVADAEDVHELDQEEEPAEPGDDFETVDEPAVERNPRMYARTPSVEPPSFALINKERTSLLSLLNAPHSHTHEAPTPRIPMVTDPAETERDDREDHRDEEEQQQHDVEEPLPQHQREEYEAEADVEAESYDLEPCDSPEPRPHTSATLYSSTTVTTTVPVRDEANQRESSASFSEKLRTPSNSSNASFDATNPALTPTMTREQALAKIRERRGRARSAANGAATPHKKMLQGVDRRDMSAPTAKVGSKKRS